MRKSDKKKNMGKANLIAENRYLESKGIIKENELGEYDYSGFENKYSGMDTERMDNLVSKGKERQVRDGIKLIPTRNSEFEVYVMPSDIHFSQPDLTELKNRGVGSEIKLTFNFSIDNSILNGKDSSDTIDINGSINAILRPLNDKEKPPYSLDVRNIRLTNNGFEGVFTPADRKGGMKLINAIKEMLIKEYGKFDMKKPLFIPGENIKAHPNSFLKEVGSMNEMEPMLENSGNEYDLRNGENVKDLLWKIRILMGSYVGTDKTADAGIANDNKVIMANLIKSGELSDYLTNELTNDLHKVGYGASDDPMITAGKGIWSNDHDAMRNFMVSIRMNPDEYKIVSRDELM